MHPKQLPLKQLRLAVALAAATTLYGCAGLHAQERSDTTTVPQALLEAAAQASHARMVYADIQARMHGSSVENVRLDTPNEGVPDFMLARVRLDYNGPMMPVLDRVANDIGYHVNEYSKPSAGVGWSPWMRVRGDKPLIDHVREMNSQVPWHIILDHRNQRLVIDYSVEGGMATQIREARETDERNRASTSSDRQITMPDTRTIEQASQVSYQYGLTNTAAQLSNEAGAPSSSGKRLENQSGQPAASWRVDIEGYQSESQALAMVDWLKEDQLDGIVIPRGKSFDVRILANNNDDAITIHSHLEGFNVPSVVGQVENGELTNTRPALPSRSSASYEQSSKPTTSQTSQITNIDLSKSNTQVAQASILSDEQETLFSGLYRIQGAHGRNLNSFGRHIKALADQGITAHLTRSGKAYNLRSGPYESEADMREALSAIRSYGFSDAYPIKPRQ